MQSIINFFIAFAFICIHLQAFGSSQSSQSENDYFSFISNVIDWNNTTEDIIISSDKPPSLGQFFNSMNESINLKLVLNLQSQWMNGIINTRNVPGTFPAEMDYFFDGLSTVLRFEFKDNFLFVYSVGYKSRAHEDWDQCVFFGTGTGPTRPTSSDTRREICFKNPVVNMLRIDDLMWLTIDTRSWGLVNFDSLETVPGRVEAPGLGFTLNAHPACDRNTAQCFVQYPCPSDKSPYSDEVCFGELMPSYDPVERKHVMGIAELSRSLLSRKKLLQQSHSPCVTPNFVVSKLDEFVRAGGDRDLPSRRKRSGLLKFLQQGEVNEWLVFDRRTNETRIMQSDISFVNNHFWNCVESEESDEIVVQTVAVTENYLDLYFRDNLRSDSVPDWQRYFKPSLECRLPITTTAEAIITNFSCKTLSTEIFDYPTFNPYFKMNPSARFFYAIALQSAESSLFFDKLVKFDQKTGAVLLEWHSEHIYLTEASFIPRSATGAGTEDDGVLLSVVYNSEENSSYVYIFDAMNLELVDKYALGEVIPFHAHGVTCGLNGECFSNP